MRPMSGTQIIRVRITIRTMHKTDQKRPTPLTMHQITRIIPTKVKDHLVPITTATQDMDTTNPTNRRNQLMYVTLHGPVSKEQLYKIQEVLRHPSQYRDRIKPEDRSVKGEYVNAFNKFHPKRWKLMK